MTKPSSAKQLMTSLSENCDLAMHLVDILLDEQACLVKMDTAPLTKLSLKKESMMHELVKRFDSYIANAGSNQFEASEAGLEQWVSLLSADEPKLMGHYETFLETLDQAKRLNSINGELVAQQLMGIQKRIEILSSAATQNETSEGAKTYSAKGGFSGGSGPRTRAVIR